MEKSLIAFLNEADIKRLGFKKSEATIEEEEKRWTAGDVQKITKTKTKTKHISAIK